MSTDPFAQYDAAYVLGSLSPEERREFEAHMTTCPECREAVAELAGMPGLLAKVRPEDLLTPHEEPPASLLPALSLRVRRERRRRLVRGSLAAAAAVAAVAAAGVGGISADQQASTVTAQAPGVQMVRLADAPLHASAALVDVPWGTQIHLTCTYEHHTAYMMDPRSYSLVVVDHSGHAQQVATWKAVPGRVSHVVGATSWKRSDIAQVEVRTPAGAPVLKLAG